MTVQTVPYALQNASHSAALFRQSASAPFVAGGALSALELAVTQQASPNMSVILGPGRAKVVGTSVSPPAGLAFTTQAMYDVLNDADTTLTIAASNPTNPRIDLVYIQVQDSFYSGAANQAIPGVVTGTPAAIPSVPATPANAVAIATIAVGAGATSIVNANIARVVSTARLISGSRGVADLDALAALTGMSISEQAWVTEIAAMFTYSGTVWRQTSVGLVASAAARDTAYNKASGVYKVAGRAQVIVAGQQQVWNGTVWSPVLEGTKMVFTRAAANVATNASLGNLALGTTALDNGSFVNTGGGVYTCQIAGKYRVALTWSFAASATGARTVRVTHSVAGTRTLQLVTVGGLDTQISCGWEYVDFAVNDTITTAVQQNSGGNLAVAGELVLERVA